MLKKLFVGNLSYSINDDQLNQIFSAYGTVESAKVITDKMSGRSKGFGFVEMSSEAEAEAAMNALNGTEMEGRNLLVNEAKPMEDRPRNGSGDRGGFRSNNNRRDFRR